MADMSWLGGAIGGTVQGILGLIGNSITNNTNQNIANQNLGFQRENLDYEKALQQQLFEREDTSYQRTVNDMRMAGLNPLSMQGTNGSGEAIATEPMHNDYQAQNVLNGVFDTMNQFMNMKNNNTLSNAQANLINAQAESQKIKNTYEEEIILNALEGSNLDNIGKRFSNERSNIAWLNDINNFAFNRQFGISDNMPDFVKGINYFTHQGELDKDFYKEFSRDWKDDSFGRTFNNFVNNPNFNSIDSVLKDTNFKGALMENTLGKILLSLIGIK